MTINEKFVSAVRMAPQVTPLTAMMSQALHDIETARSKGRFNRLEDWLAKYGPKAKDVMAELYSKIHRSDYVTTVIDWDPVFDSFRKELRELEGGDFLRGRHTFGAEFGNGIWLCNPGFIIDLALLFDDPAKSAKLKEVIDASKELLDGRHVAAAVGLPLTVVNAFFKKYEEQGQGTVSKTIGESLYIPPDAKEKEGSNLKEKEDSKGQI